MIHPNEKWHRIRFYLAVYGLHLLGITLFGLGLAPALMGLRWVWRSAEDFPEWLRVLCLAFSVGPAYLIFGLTLIFLSVCCRQLFGFRVKPGLYHYYRDTEVLKWMGYNSLILVVNGAFLDVFRLSPFQTLFYRLMGAKIGKDVQINTGGLADLSLLEIGDDSTIGGGVALICHAAERGFLKLAPTRLGKGVSIGISSIIMPDAEIGDGASVAPSSVVLTGSRIPPRSVWGGDPAEDLREKRRREHREKTALNK